MFDFLKNKTIYHNKYKTNSKAVIISCYFNPQKSPYRLKAFNVWYESIKHLNHRIVECVIGEAEPQLPENDYIQRIYTPNLLWHKESLLNNIVESLPEEYRYVFWVDADVLFTNNNWLIDSVEVLQTANIVQPFEYCVHMEKDELTPSINVEAHKAQVQDGTYLKNRRVWRSFCANYGKLSKKDSETYHLHGHVGFAWGARREILDRVPLYDKALIGGADHIIAHAAVGEVKHKCIMNAFADNIEEIVDWSREFYLAVQGKVGYAPGDLYHIWHGDIDKREYLKRIKDFTPETKNINMKDKNGLYVTHKEDHKYIKNYFRKREVSESGTYYEDDGFLESMALGYMTDSTMMGTLLGGNLPGAMIGDMLNNADEVDEAPAVTPYNEVPAVPPPPPMPPIPVPMPIQIPETVQEAELLPMPREVEPDNFS